MRLVQVVSTPGSLVVLPNGRSYSDGDLAHLTDEDFLDISQAAMGTVVLDLGDVTGDEIPDNLHSIEIAPGAPAIDLASETTEQLVVTATLTDEEEIDVTAYCAYSSDDEDVATVSPSGLITALSTGTADITATLGDTTDTVTVTVSDSG